MRQTTRPIGQMSMDEFLQQQNHQDYLDRITDEKAMGKDGFYKGKVVTPYGLTTRYNPQ